MKTKTTAVLLLAIIVLGIVFLVKHPTRSVEISYSLPDWQLPVDTSKVVKIRIRKGPASVAIERQHGIWKQERGERIAVDGALVNRLLKGVADFRLLGLVSSNPRKQDLFDVGEAGTTVMVATDDGSEMSLVVGRMTSLPSRSYVRPTSSDMVYLARGLTAEVIEGEAFGGLRRKTFHVDTAAILMISVGMGQTSVVVHRQGRGWISAETAIPDDQMAPVLHSLQDIKAERVDEWKPRDGEQPLITVDILEQKQVRLEFYPGGPGDSTYALKTSLSPEPCTVEIKVAQPLLKLVSYTLYQAARVAPQPVRQAAQPHVAQAPRRVAAVPPPPTTSEITPGTGLEEEGDLSIHVVRPGDTLESLAQQYNVTKGQLMQWNLLTEETLRPGTELYVFVRK